MSDGSGTGSPWHGPRGELLVGIQFLLFFAFVLTPTWNPWVDQALLGASREPRIVLLAIGMLVAFLFGAFGLLGIRRYLTPLPYPVDHSQLVTAGVYGLVRHPLYASQLFAATGWTCFTLSIPHAVLLIAGFVFFDYKASKEEAWLTERHPEYPQYAGQVKKLVPWVY